MFEYVGYKNVVWRSSRSAFSLVGMLVYCRVIALRLIQSWHNLATAASVSARVREKAGTGAKRGRRGRGRRGRGKGEKEGSFSSLLLLPFLFFFALVCSFNCLWRTCTETFATQTKSNSPPANLIYKPTQKLTLRHRWFPPSIAAHLRLTEMRPTSVSVFLPQVTFVTLLRPSERYA